MNAQYACVTGSDMIYRNLVLVCMEGGQEKILNYTLKDGEQLVYAMPPAQRVYGSQEGLIRPRWNQETARWEESALAEEVLEEKP